MADGDEIQVPIEVTAAGVDKAEHATEVINGLTKALKALNAETKNSAEGISAQKQAADELAASARQLAVDRKKARDAERTAQKKDAAERAQIEKQAADEIAAARRQLSVDRKKAADDERAARRADRETQRAERRQLRDEELASSRQLFADRQRQRQQDAAARRAAYDKERADRRQLDDELKASSRQIAADRQKRREQEAAAARTQQQAAARQRQEATAAQRQSLLQARDIVKAQKDTTAAIEEQRQSWSNMAKVIVAAAVAFAGFQGFRAIINEGLEFNKTLETATLGIAALITAQVEMRDKNDQVVSGVEKLRIAQVLAAEQVAKLRIASLQTVGSTNDLVIAFQQAAAVGFRYGLTLDQVRVISVRMAQAANNIGLPLNQLNEEIRSLLAGTINPRNTRIATALNITNEQVKAAQKAGTLFDFVSKKLEAFAVAGEETARTFSGTMANVRKALETLAGEATAPLFDSLRTLIHEALTGVFDQDTARISDNFAGIVSTAQDLFAGLGSSIADAIDLGVQKAQELSDWLNENARAVDDILTVTGLLVDEFGSLLGDATKLALALADSGTEAGFFKTVIVGAGLVVAGIHEAFQLILVSVGAIGALILTAIIAPMIGFLKIAAQVAGVFDDDVAAKLENMSSKLDGFITGMAKGFQALGKDWSENGLAIDKFLKKLDESGPASEKAFAATEKLRTGLRALEDQETSATRELDKQLAARTITQKEYAAKVAELNIKTVQGQIAAQKEYFNSLDQSDTRERERTNRLIQQLKRREDALKRGITLRTNTPPEDAEDKKAGTQARDRLRAETIRNKQELSEQLRDLKASLANQELSYKEYYDRVTKAQQDFFAKQIAAQERLKAVTKDPAKREAIQAQIDAFRSESDQVREDNNAKELEDEKKLAEEVMKARIQLLKDEGKLTDARTLEIGDKYKKLIAQLKAEGDTEGADLVARLFNVDNAKTKLEELMGFAKTASDRLTTELSAIQTEVTAHAITEEQARLKILDAYVRTRDELEKMLPAMQAAAALTVGTSDDAEVENLRIKIQQLNTTILQTADYFFKLKEAGREGLSEGLTNFFTDAITGAKSWGDAVRAAAMTVVQSLARVASQMLTNIILQRAMGFVAGVFGGGGGGSALNSFGFDMPTGAAQGAYVSGPGTTTSDSVGPFWLSNREVVVNAAAAEAIGVERLMAANRMFASAPTRRNRMASGGLVEAKTASGGARDSVQRFVFRVESDPGQVVRVMKSPEGTNAQIETARLNRRAYSRVFQR